MGFDGRFLGVQAAMPRVETDASGAPPTVALDYLHFTVVLDPVRRLARVTGVNVDGAALVDLARGDDWRLDERIPADWQAGPEIYVRNDLDRGHLVRRRDPVWGPPQVAARANADTFHYPNAAPQAAGFNQSAELWLGLEDHVLAFADVNDLRLSVFTAPFLEPDDPPYRGIRVPLRFWKVVAWVRDEVLATAGFVLDQSPLVDVERGVRPGASDRSTAPDLGPFRTFQAPVADIAAIAGLAMPGLVAADRMPRTVAAAGWKRVREPADLLL
ncbi:DNA/RNA non-specific endonuclease [Agromyces larvae]|uniref:DNA/RNA non-specific endonuclease n=1 Tax=Agromyces larvae TaxID=2929802 RepID=A0ABY4BWE1_9MICO|nr:DNA/RNA non-specific endonuclease [Agromyces larvae]UOE43503.1 DNA/RNA non-specific endonuclease [Agromyces larvae]